MGLTTEPAPQTTTAKVPFGGLHGQPQEYTIVNEPFGENPNGAPGKYKMVFTLSKPDAPIPRSGTVDFSPRLMGDSYIKLPPDDAAKKTERPMNPPFQRLRIRGLTPQGPIELVGFPNDTGRLGLIECDLEASSFRDAKQSGFRALAVALSSWSAQLDIPIDIERIHITEISTTTAQVDWTVPYPNIPLALGSEATIENAEFRGCASLYREGMNSSSPVYRFLCFFKVIEGIRARRKRADRAAELQKLPVPVRTPEVVPKEQKELAPWLNRIYHTRREWDGMALDSIFRPESRGETFEAIIENRLNPLRVNIAHALFEGGELTLSADELLQAAQVEDWLPLVKCMARRMLKNEFPKEFLTFLGENGVVRP